MLQKNRWECEGMCVQIEVATSLESESSSAPRLWLSVEHGLFLLAGSLFVSLFGATILSLIHRWTSDSNYSHGFLIPIVSALLFLHNRSGTTRIAKGSTSASAPQSSWQLLLSVSIIVSGLLLQGATILVPSLVAESLAMLTVLAGLVHLVGGSDIWRRARLPIGFLLFMIPWPAAIYSRIAFPLQELVSTIAVAIFAVLGTAALRTGNLIHLPNQTMHVAESCSGIRQLSAFVAISVCTAFLLARPLWYRVTILLFAIPIAIVVNVLRVVATGVAITNGWESWTTGILHDAEGLMMVGVGLAMLRGIITVLDWLLVMPDVVASDSSLDSRSGEMPSTTMRGA